MAMVLMVQGTMSNVGKSLITAGLCRIFKQDGLKVAPVGPVYQAGTLSGNPVAMAAGLTQLKILADNPEIYENLNKKAAPSLKKQRKYCVKQACLIS